MKKITTILSSLLLVAAVVAPSLLSAQSCPWAKKTGGNNEDYGRAVATDANGNVYYLGNFYTQSIVIGTTTLSNQPYQAFNYGSEMYLAKYDSCGTFKWAKKAGGNSETVANGVAVDAAGNIYVTGWSTADTVFFGNKYLVNVAMRDVFIAKYSPAGAVIWVKQGSGNDWDMASSITIDGQNNLYVAGRFASSYIKFGTDSFANGTNDGYVNDAFVAKFDTAGNVSWITGSTSHSGTSGHVFAYGITGDAAGNTYVGGKFSSAYIRYGNDSLPMAGYYDMYLVKLDPNGNEVWLKGAGDSNEDNINAVASDAAGNVTVTGWIGGTSTVTVGSYTLTNSGQNRAVFIAQYDNTGAVQWAKTAKGNYWSDNLAFSVSLDAAGNSYITGTFSSDSLKFGSAAIYNTSYTNGSGGGDYFYDVFVAKYKANGTASWARNAGGDSTDMGNGIATGPHNALYLTGSFNSPVFSIAGVPTLTLSAGSIIGSYNPGVMSNDAFICNNISTLQVMPPLEMCLVSADTMWGGNQYNVVYWDKTPYTTVSSFIVYREVTSGVYKRIGSQPYSALSMFIDTARSVGPANGNPFISTYRYKIQIMDTAGTYSFMSPYHNTVYFQNNSGTFNWNLYSVENMTITPVSQFDLMRDDNGTGAWHSIGTTAGTQTTLNDPQYATYTSTADWRVDAQGFNCTPTFRLSGNTGNQSAIIKSKSNITNNKGIGVNQLAAVSQQLAVYPNPSKGTFVVETNLTEKQNIQVIDVTGKVVLSTVISGTTTIDAHSLNEGVYVISIVNSGKAENKRLVVVK